MMELMKDIEKRTEGLKQLIGEPYHPVTRGTFEDQAKKSAIEAGKSHWTDEDGDSYWVDEQELREQNTNLPPVKWIMENK